MLFHSVIPFLDYFYKKTKKQKRHLIQICQKYVSRTFTPGLVNIYKKTQNKHLGKI